MSDEMTTTKGPPLVVRVAGAPEVRYMGDGEWFGKCCRPGCEEWRVGFTRAEATRLIDEHWANCTAGA